MNKAYSLITIKSIDEEQRVVTGLASTPTPDRVGDIVESSGAVYKLPMPLLLDHDHTMQVGHVEFAKATPQGIPFTARIAKIAEPGQARDMVDRAWHLVKYRLRAAVSIGFRALEDGVERMADGGYRFNRWEWIELSLVSVPANADAVIFNAKSMAEAANEIRKVVKADRDRVVKLDKPVPLHKARERSRIVRL